MCGMANVLTILISFAGILRQKRGKHYNVAVFMVCTLTNSKQIIEQGNHTKLCTCSTHLLKCFHSFTSLCNYANLLSKSRCALLNKRLHLNKREGINYRELLKRDLDNPKYSHTPHKHTCTHTHAHTHARTHTHTHTHTHRYTYAGIATYK